jgi:hypothetical protein
MKTEAEIDAEYTKMAEYYTEDMGYKLTPEQFEIPVIKNCLFEAKENGVFTFINKLKEHPAYIAQEYAGAALMQYMDAYLVEILEREGIERDEDW